MTTQAALSEALDRFRKFETLSPFELKDELIRIAKDQRQHGRLPQRRPRKSQLDRDDAARSLLPLRPIRDRGIQTRLGRTGPRRDARRERHRGALRCFRGEARRRARRGDAEDGDRPRRQQARLPKGSVGLRTDRCDHRRHVSRTAAYGSPHGEGRARIPRARNVRRQPAGRYVRHLRGRRRHGRDVLHLRYTHGQRIAQAWRSHRAGSADVHAVHRDRAPRQVLIRNRRGQRHRTLPLGCALLAISG